MIEVDQEHRQRDVPTIRTREGGIEAAAKLAGVGQTRQSVGGRLLAAPLITEGIRDRHRGAPGQRVDREQILVGECGRALAQQDDHGCTVAGCDGDHQALTVGGEHRLAGARGLRDLMLVERFAFGHDLGTVAVRRGDD